MNIEGGLFTDLVVIFAAAAGGGLAARLLRLPALLGYIALGLLIGPGVFEFVDDPERVETFANLGVILLLFAIGIEISFREIYQMTRVVVGVGIVQIVLTASAVYPLGFYVLGFSSEEAAVLGLVAALSSTMVVLKTLSDQGELHSLHGRILTGVLLVQDLAFVPIIALLPALSGDDFLSDLGFGLLKAGVLLGLMVILGGKGIPWLLDRVTALGSREIFIVTVVSITFVSAAATESLGLSAALGAFVAGLLLSETDFGHRALSEVVPLRDTFAALFFVSLGMLTDPGYLADNLDLVLPLVAAIIFVKFVLTAVMVRAFGFLPHTSVLTGLGMGQIGEFSFILVGSATTLGIVTQDFLTLTVISAVITMALTPLMLAGGSQAVNRLGHRVAILSPHRLSNRSPEDQVPPMQGHAIVCGLGRVGHLVADELIEHNVPVIGVDLDPYVVAEWKSLGRQVIHGSSDSETVLEAARVKDARLMVISVGDPIAAWLTAQHALRVAPDLDIVARVHWRDEGERFQGLGVQEVVWPQMEAGLEILRHALYRFHTDPTEVETLVANLRDHLSFGESDSVEAMMERESGDVPIVDPGPDHGDGESPPD
ncbi:MAG: cation:proton antiporter [Chloroflexi bacterium]|nr:cation:proton antiporter [Chloroflexota bacterium]